MSDGNGVLRLKHGSSTLCLQVFGDLVGRWGQDMKALQWHSDDPMTMPHVLLKAPIYRSTVSYTAPVHNIWDHSCDHGNGVLRLKQGHPLCLQVLGALVGRWGQDMKAIQWHSDDPMTYAHVLLQRTHLPVNRIIC